MYHIMLRNVQNEKIILKRKSELQLLNVLIKFLLSNSFNCFHPIVALTQPHRTLIELLNELNKRICTLKS